MRNYYVILKGRIYLDKCCLFPNGGKNEELFPLLSSPIGVMLILTKKGRNGNFKFLIERNAWRSRFYSHKSWMFIFDRGSD